MAAKLVRGSSHLSKKMPKNLRVYLWFWFLNTIDIEANLKIASNECAESYVIKRLNATKNWTFLMKCALNMCFRS